MQVEMPRLTNNTGIALSMAVWLAQDDYDYINDPNYISATTLIKSPRQIILGKRSVDKIPEAIDISSLMARALGNSVHSSVESAWLNNYRESLTRLNYPVKVIDRIKINPKPEELTEGTSPIYMEQRAFREVGKYTIGGKFDFVGDGQLDDTKTTGVYSYMSGSNEWKYMMQGSIYRWLNPDIITSNHMNIQFVFTDWSKRDSMAQKAKGYPATRIFQHKIILKSLPETDVWITERINLIESLMDAPESSLPLCGPEDLWQDAPTYKYYKNPAKKTRSTANFTTDAEATIRWIEDGRVGEVVQVPGATKGCMYCDAFNQCTQKDALIASGSLHV